MQEDYHYYTVYHLAKLAGLGELEAEVVAYASQYVDDSTESEPIEPFSNQHFDTVRTAHYNLGAFDWNVQKKIYIPFHFLPSQVRWHNPDKFSYVTQPASMNMDDLGANLVELALAEPNEKFRYIRMGVALHTIADTFSHFGFSGRHAHENDIKRIWINGKGKPKQQSFKSFCDIFVPQIGHVEAFEYPDLPYLSWQYDNHRKKRKERSNTEYCLKGAQLIYRYLKKMNGDHSEAVDLRSDHPEEYQKMESMFCTHGDLKKRCKLWKAYTNAPEYNKIKWRKEALKGKVEWDDMSKGQCKYHVKAIRGKDNFDSTNWAYFHRAAHIQRNQVLAWLN